MSAKAKKSPARKTQSHTEESRTARISEYAYIPEELKSIAVPLGKIKLWGKNPRKNEEAAKKLATMIKAQGAFTTPIVLDKQGVVRAGNTRLKAAKILGMTHIPAVTRKFKSDIAATAYAIGDNKAGEWSEWDDDVLSGLMTAEKIGTESGFTKKEIEEISITQESTTGITEDSLFSLVSFFAKKSSLQILNYGIVKSGKLSMSDLTSFAVIDIPGAKDGIVDLHLFSKSRNLSASYTTAVSGEDFPESPKVGKLGSFSMPDILLSDFAEYSSQDISLGLNSVFITKTEIFATDGHHGIIKDVSFSKIPDKGIAIPSDSAGLNLSIQTIAFGDEYAVLSGDGFSILTKLNDVPAPNIRKALPKNELSSKIPGSLGKAISSLLLFANEKMKFIAFSADGHLCVNNRDTGKAFKILMDGMSLPEFPIGFNAGYLLECIDGQDAILFPDNAIACTIFPGKIVTKFLMPLRIIDDFTPEVYEEYPVDTPEFSFGKEIRYKLVGKNGMQITGKATYGIGVTEKRVVDEIEGMIAEGTEFIQFS